MGKRKKTVHYVDNAKFLEEMIEYKKQYKISINNNKELPIISEYLGSVFLKIAQRLYNRPNYISLVDLSKETPKEYIDDEQYTCFCHD